MLIHTRFHYRRINNTMDSLDQGLASNENLNTLSASLRRRRLLLIAFALAIGCVAILLAAATTPRFPRRATSTTTSDKVLSGLANVKWQLRNASEVINKTEALQVIALEPTKGGQITFRLKNVSLKHVNCYVIAAGGGLITIDTSSGDRAIIPQATEEFIIPAAQATGTLQILAAAFTDGTVEGEPTTVSSLKKWRSDLKLQLRRSLSILNETLNSSEADSPTSLDTLEIRFSSLETRHNTSAIGEDSGLRDVRDGLVSEIQRVRTRLKRQGDVNSRELLRRLKQRIERRIEVL